MRRILMRGAVSPLIRQKEIEVMVRDYIGTNSGNLLYAYGVFRTLLTEDTMIDMDHYAVEGRRFSEEDIEYINSEYDAYVLPMADAFRNDFRNKLLYYSQFFSKLTIPCYIIGVGLKAEYEPKLKDGFSFDEEVRSFISAALNKSVLVGVRGSITGEYLSLLGFKEERDYTVIGCPSVYTYGAKLSQRKLQISEDSRISLNGGYVQPDEPVTKYLYDIANRYPNYQYVAQRTEELRTFCIGIPNSTIEDSYYPWGIEHKFYKENRVKFFVSAEAWIQNMHHIDFSIGTRLHGNIAAVLGGVPALFIPIDSRMRELVEYHGFPQMPRHLFDTGCSLEEIVEKVDMESYMGYQAHNFRHFIDFLNSNKLKHIYDGDMNRTDAPIDGMMPHYDGQVQSFVIRNKEDLKDLYKEYDHQVSVWESIRSESGLVYRT
ncbi:MAG: polysaccharide pyruvyl transferase family protein [Lachnospiraceae bacterium]|nr:polysaccharide pyruvyl transferase family protein [Lachnospiraceae bacterium]MDE7204187.1 polysaccharide pyruvyl transferase family protein [Lachnospiraceae bacterium]